MPHGVKLRHVRLGKGGLVKCALGYETECGKPTGVFVLWNGEGLGYSRYFINDNEKPEDLTQAPACYDKVVYVYGFKYTRDARFDLLQDRGKL